jgi:general nucleoside transport system ATP-binding protein
MKILFGLLEPDGGSVLWKGEPVKFSSPHEAVLQGIGMVQQNLCLGEGLTVLENVIANHEPHRKGFVCKREAEDRLRMLMEKLGCELPLNKTIEQAALSISQRQLIEIMRLLWRRIDLLILDEPTSALGPIEISALFKLLRELKAEGVTVIIITHRLPEVLDIADRISVLRNGRLVSTVEKEDADDVSLTRLMFGNSKTSDRIVAEVRDVPTLSIKNLTSQTLSDFSFEILDGEVVGVAALPQNGGEELAEILGAIRAPSAGAIRLDGMDVTRATVRQRAAAGIAYIPEDSVNEATIGNLSVAENFALGRMGEFSSQRFGMRVMQWGCVFREAETLRDDFGVRFERLQQPVATLSGGNIQRMIIARAVDSNPRILIMMHPTKCLDVYGASEVMDWIHDRIEAEDSALQSTIIISPDLEELLGNCHRILVLYRGRVIGEYDGCGLSDNDVEIMGRLLTGSSADEASAGNSNTEEA